VGKGVWQAAAAAASLASSIIGVTVERGPNLSLANRRLSRSGVSVASMVSHASRREENEAVVLDDDDDDLDDPGGSGKVAVGRRHSTVR
jgi:hypothetical protein